MCPAQAHARADRVLKGLLFLWQGAPALTWREKEQNQTWYKLTLLFQFVVIVKYPMCQEDACN